MLKFCVITVLGVGEQGTKTGEGRAIAEKLWTPVLRLRKKMTERESLSRVNATAYYSTVRMNERTVTGLFPMSLCYTPYALHKELPCA